LQIETADSIKNMESIAAVEGVDMLFLGQNGACASRSWPNALPRGTANVGQKDLCMSMGLFEVRASFY